jgi:hypothetical protein
MQVGLDFLDKQGLASFDVPGGEAGEGDDIGDVVMGVAFPDRVEVIARQIEGSGAIVLPAILSIFRPLGLFGEKLSQAGFLLLVFGGHPVACAVAMANLEVFEADGVLDNVRNNGEWFGQQLAELGDRHEIVGDVRGTGYFWALELVKDRDNKVSFDDQESEDLLRGFLSSRLLELGLICRADDRDEPVIQLSPPLIADREILGEVLSILDQVLGEAMKRVAQ